MFYKDYKQIKAKAKKENKEETAKRCADILQNWEQIKGGWLYREKLTKRQKEKPETEQKKIIIEKIKKEQADKLARFLEECDQIANAQECEYIKISVNWAKSATWGWNPHAELWTNDGYYTGRASGCGYDKLSAATAEALNKSKSVLKLLYNKYEQALRKNKNATKRDVLGYGSGYSKPYFEGGVGYSSHWSIFKNLGAKINTHQEGKTWDCMEIRF